MEGCKQCSDTSDMFQKRLLERPPAGDGRQQGRTPAKCPEVVVVGQGLRCHTWLPREAERGLRSRSFLFSVSPGRRSLLPHP